MARQIKFPKGEAQALFFIAVANNTLGNNSKALELQLKRLQIADRNNLTVEKQLAMTSLGSNYRNLQNYSKALFYLYQALKLADPNDPKRSGPMYLTLYGIANTYLLMNKLDSAEHYSQLAV